MDPSREIALTGLIGSRPIGALAAYGLLRWTAEIEVLRGSALHWKLEDDWIAVLQPPNPLTADQLCELLLAEHARAERFPHLDWAPAGTLRVPVEDFISAARECVAGASVAARLLPDFFAAYGSDAVVDQKGQLRPTRLHMTSGQQQFRSLLSDLAASLKPDGRAKARQTPAALLGSVREALFGPWTYPDSEHSLGWDPDSERMHAMRAQAPTDDKYNKSVRFAVWLAHWALPLLPTVAMGARLNTTGFVEARRERPRFRWPVWEAPIELQTLSSLLTSAALVGEGAALGELERRGVAALYESIRHEFGQGYGVLRSARLVEGGEESMPPPAQALVF